jgi:uncharacterized OB-fold protein
MGKITAAVCKCGQILLPPRDRCITCSGVTQPLEINDHGKILTFTVLYSTPEGFNSPLVLGIIELDDVPSSNNLKHPKLVCESKLPAPKLKIGLRVKVIKIDDKYYFTHANKT